MKDIVNTPRFNPDTVWKSLAPLRVYFNPQYFGWDNIVPSIPSLFVCNHSIYGMFDALVMGAEIYRRKGIVIRGLGDTWQHKVPGVREFMTGLASVPGTPENCAKLMEAGEHIIVFPGGGREVCKRKGESYALLWKKRTGFVRMAVQYGYPMIPVAAVGIDSSYSILFDADDLQRSIIGKLLQRSGIWKKYLRNGDAVPPIARGIGLTPLPRPERLYFSFAPPITTAGFEGRHDDPETLMSIRQSVESALLNQIRDLLYQREQDTGQGGWRRILNAFL